MRYSFIVGTLTEQCITLFDRLMHLTSHTSLKTMADEIEERYAQSQRDLAKGLVTVGIVGLSGFFLPALVFQPLAFVTGILIAKWGWMPSEDG